MNFQSRTALLAIVAFLWGCGGTGETSNSTSGSAISSTVTGSIQSSTGSSAEFEGWVLALVDSETGESRVAEIDATGTYSFNQVEQRATYTLVLLNVDYRLASVLSLVAADQPGFVYQYFQLEESAIPRLIHKGPAIEFSDPSAVSIQTLVASDSDSDGVPDGLESSSSLTANTGSQSDATEPLVEGFSLLADADEDGIRNENDSDIDGDGLANWFDEDDDGNDTLDIFDLDANGDVVLDANQTVGDHYFGEEVEHIAIQVFSKPDDVIEMKISVKIDDELIQPSSVAVLGSTDLFDESRIVVKGETGGEEAGDIWDRSLNDDGGSFDDSAADGIYAQKIKLKTGSTPDANQTLFVSVNMGSYSREFPFSFPSVTLDEIDFSYTSSSERITKSGNPFGSDETSYLWTVNVFDDAGGLVHSSAQQEGASNRYTIPEEDISDSTITYSAKVFAQSLEKVSGFPVYVIESEEETLD